MILSRKAICDNYNVCVNTVKMLVRHGFIKKVAYGKYEFDENFFKDFDEKMYLVIAYENKKKALLNGLHNMSEEKKALRIEHMSSSQKIAQNRESTKALRNASIKRYFNEIETEEHKNNRIKKLIDNWNLKTDEEKQQWSKDCSNRSKQAYANMSNEAKLLHRQNVSNSLKAQRKLLRDSGYCQSKEWKEKAIEIQKKIYNTKKKNGTFNSSRLADSYKQRLRELGIDFEEEKAYPNESNLHCDIYIKKQDLWIELHFSHYHNYCPFDKDNLQHQEEIKALQEAFERTPKNSKGDNQYGKIIYTWSDLDTRKKQNAIRNELNWIAFYDPKDFDNYIEKFLM